MNGSSGIAVGMATNMAPHNLREVIAGIMAYIDNNDITVEELMQHIKGPDFPTAGTIYGFQGIKSAFETGRGRIVVRSNATIELTKEGREQIIVSDIPYMVNKAAMIEKTAGLINEKKIEGISDIRDESDRSGLRIVYDIKKDANANVVLNTLYKMTALQSSFSVNNICLVKGRPELLNLKGLISNFVEHRHEVVIRRTQFELNEAEKRAHILEGLIIASDNIDEVISIIRNSKSPDEAREKLMERFALSDIQSRAIVEMRLRHLTGLEQDKLRAEYAELMKTIERLKEILASEELRMNIIKTELTEMSERYGDERRTQIVHSSDDIGIEDLIADDDMVITISNEGYIKRTPLTEFKTQNRGGVGSKGAATKNTDYTEHLFVASMHNTLLIFTDAGKVYWQKVYQLPEGSKISKGRPIQNLINIEQGEKISSIINVKSLDDADYINNHFLVMVTKNGIIKKTTLEAYSRPRSSGINAITFKEGDALLDVKLTTGNCEIVIGKRKGKAIRFNESGVRPMGRTATGVRAANIEDEDDYVVGVAALEIGSNSNILVVSENGYGKRSDIDEYRVTKRGGKGVKTLNITEKTGSLVCLLDVTDENDLMIINKSGITIRLDVRSLRVMGRATQGVRLIKLNEDDQISSIAKVQRLADEEVEIDESVLVQDLEELEPIDEVEEEEDDVVDESEDTTDETEE